MNSKTSAPPNEAKPDITAGIRARILTVTAFLLLQAVLLFTCSGNLNWTWAWVYLGLSVVFVLINGVIMLRANPETVAERGRPSQTKDWDKIVGGLWGLALYFLVPILAGFDARFRWTQDLHPAWHIASAAVLLASWGLGGWAMLANAYFSTAVRIQSERGHTVCNWGPYRFVRHPGYVGFILQSLATPLLLGSLWSLITGVAAAALMILRTALEDRTLQAELPGYLDYVQQVHYRLLPGIW